MTEAIKKDTEETHNFLEDSAEGLKQSRGGEHALLAPLTNNRSLLSFIFNDGGGGGGSQAAAGTVQMKGALVAPPQHLGGHVSAAERC